MVVVVVVAVVVLGGDYSIFSSMAKDVHFGDVMSAAMARSPPGSVLVPGRCHTVQTVLSEHVVSPSRSIHAGQNATSAWFRRAPMLGNVRAAKT